MRRHAILLLALSAPAPVLAAQELLTPELLLGLKRVGDPQPSPDGTRLLYAVTTTDIPANKRTTHLFLLDLKSGEKRQLTATGSNNTGRWSPDGRQIAFLSSRGAGMQVYVLPLEGGEARQVTSVEGGVSNLSWSPTGSHFAFTARVKLDKNVKDLHPDLPRADARVYDELMPRHWDEWKDGTYSHLFVVPASGGKPKDLMDGERFDTPLPPFGGGEQIAWSPDGRELCYTCRKVAGSAIARSTNSDLYVVPVEGGAARNLTEGLGGYETDPSYSPDGAWLAFLSMERAGFEADRNRLMLLDRKTGKSREAMAKFDQSAHSPLWLADSKSLVFASETRGTTQIYALDLAREQDLAGAGRGPRALTKGRWQFDAPALARDGVVYCQRQRTERPPEVVAVKLDGSEPEGKVITHENDEAFTRLKLPIVEERQFAATDGQQIHAWVVKPPDFDPKKRWPMLLYCQGGPQSMVGQWFSTRWNFHLMAAKGYVVLGVNRRGLPGFGQAWNDQISKDWGGQAMQDLLTACDAMRAEPFVDPARVAAVGASFGGYTVYWLMGNGGDRFCAMIAHCGVFNLESMYGSTEELWFVDWDLGGPYWQSSDVRQLYERDSPHRYVGKWKTPLLVIHGEKDFRVPYTEGLQAFTAAQVQGIPSRFLCFPEEGHWVSTPQNGVLWQRVFFDWLDRWCKKQG